MISYSPESITISDDANPSRPPLVLPSSATSAEVSAALQAYFPPPPPPPPEPDWDAFREGLRTQNGYQNYFAQAAQQQLLTAASLPVDFYDFRKTGNYGPFLTLLSQVFSLLPLEDRVHVLTELIQLSQNCHLPQSFVNELIQLAQSSAS